MDQKEQADGLYGRESPFLGWTTRWIQDIGQNLNDYGHSAAGKSKEFSK